VLQSTSSKAGFSLIKDGVGGFIERWMDRHALRIIAKEMSVGDIVRFTADDDSFRDLVERVVTYRAAEALDEHYSQGFVPSDQELMDAMQDATQKLTKSGLFVSLVKKIIADQLETQVFVTNEEMDVGVTVQNLISMLPVAPEFKDAIIRQAFDLMGLPEPKMPKQAPQANQMGNIPQLLAQGAGQAQNSAPPALAPQQAQQVATNALTR
jgi:hypothetical protein